MCVQQKFKPACAFAQTEPSLRFMHEETLHPWPSKVRPVKILIRLRKNAGWSASTLGTFSAVAVFHITKTCLYNFDAIKVHFYTVKFWFTGVYIIFLISAQERDCAYSLEPPRTGGSNKYTQSMFWAEIWKLPECFILKNKKKKKKKKKAETKHGKKIGGKILNIFDIALRRISLALHRITLRPLCEVWLIQPLL